MGFEIKNGMLIKYTEEPGVTDVVIPERVKTIGNNVFEGCRNIKSITIPADVLEISINNFKGCRNLTLKLYDSMGGNTYISNGFIAKYPPVMLLHKIIVLSKVTDKTVFEVIMDAEYNDYNYFNLLNDAWGNNATFDFKRLDEFFPHIKGKNIKIKVALSRLKYKYDLSPETEIFYRTYLSQRSKSVMEYVLSEKDPELLRLAAEYNCIKKTQITGLIETASKENMTDFTTFLLDYRNRNFSEKDMLSVEAGARRKEQKELETVFGLRPLPVSNLKKLFDYKEYENGELIITSCKVGESKIIIPTNIEGNRKIKRIGSRSFSAHYDYCKNEKILNSRYMIKSVVIPDGVTDIDDEAFYCCYRLSSINIPESVNRIGERAFCCCGNLKELEIPDGVSEICEEAFSSCIHITIISIPESVKKIGRSAFCGCCDLNTVIITNSTTEINEFAFFRCDPNLIIKAKPGSKAEEYARNWNIRFEELL